MVYVCVVPIINCETDLEMKHATASRRQRNRNGGSRRGNQQRMQVYDSNGPDVRIRGTAHQVAEKYLALAKDASSAGDPIMAENYYQHAEHYIRIINELSGDVNIPGLRDDVRDGNTLNAGYAESRNVGGNASRGPEKPDKHAKDLDLPASILGAPVATHKDTAKEKQSAEASE